MTLRTPDERFAALEDFPFAPHYVTVDGLRIHYVDEGPRGGPVVLLLHGEPSWSYLYRKMIPPLAAAGCRVVAPDLVGFGRSDKLERIEDYSYARHVAWLTGFVEALDLSGITLFAQDWGGLLGLRVAAEHPARFDRIAISNTGLPTGRGTPTPGFLQWREFARTVPDFRAGKIVNKGTANGISPGAIAAYDAPFPDPTYQAGARAFPQLVPIDSGDPAASANIAAWRALKTWNKPFLTLFSDRDPITAGGAEPFQARVPGAAGQPHQVITGGGHFVQEDCPGPLTAAILDLMARTPEQRPS